jgi:M6 family metalloprotease-like protein
MLTNMSIGFPIPDNRLNPKEPINLQILPVDFSNVRATNSPIYDFGKVISNMTKFWESQSNVGLNINVNMPREYLNLEKTVDSFNLNLSLSNFQPDNYRSYVQYVIDQWSTKISFKGINVVAVVVPPNISASQIGTWVVDTQAIFHTPSGNLYNTLITGNGSSITDLAAWTHEFGHTLGLTDMRYVDSSNLSIQRPEGLGIFDLMGSGGSAPETIVWNRFLTGMIRDDQVHCITNFEKSLHWIIPVEGNGSGLKGVVIALSKTKAIVMESRRAIGYDSFLGTSSEGLLVYEVDTTIPYHQSPVHIISPEGSIDKDWNTDSALRLNQFVVDSGWKITVIESGDFGDVVKVEKVL